MAAPHKSPDVNELKRALRARMLAARETWQPQQAGAALAEHVLRRLAPPDGAVVSGFWPIGQEIDIRPLLAQLHEKGHPIVLPVTPKRGNPLTFRLWHPDDPLIAEPFGTFRSEGPERAPDFLLVPLLGFDRRGYRVGYGGGFYDRTLTSLPGRFALGCAYAGQEVQEVPIGPGDVALNAVATDRDIIICRTT